VVVGTVIDPSMGDELRVTVVATGLGMETAKVPLQVVESPSRAASIDIDLEPDYAQFERPTAMRKSRRAGGAGQTMTLEAGGEEYFDIPAFLRRQAD
jgi:cell division protein FtsZ